MERFTRIAVTLSIVSLLGCRPKIGYFSIDVYSKPFHKKVDLPLKVVLKDDVKDEFEMRDIGPITYVSEFRKTMEEGLKSTLSKNFDVKFGKDDKQGLIWVIYRVYPKWVIAGTKITSTGVPGQVGYGVSASPVYALSCQYESRLFYNDELIKSADGNVVSDGQATLLLERKRTFKGGVQKFIEELNRQMFDDETVKRILER